jgi:hypothetical protein
MGTKRVRSWILIAIVLGTIADATSGVIRSSTIQAQKCNWRDVYRLRLPANHKLRREYPYYN